MHCVRGKVSPLVFIVLLFGLNSSLSHSSVPKILQSLKATIHNSNYSSDIRPTEETNSSTLVSVNTYIRELHDIDDDKMEISIQLTLRVKWTDARLRYEAPHDLKYVTLSEETQSRIWSPDLYFTNEAKSMQHQVIKPNFYIRLFPDGKIVWSSRYSVVFFCPLDFKFFPFDKQRCNIEMSSYGQNTDNIMIEWDKEDAFPVKLVSDQRPISRFQFLGFGTSQGAHGSSSNLQDAYSHIVLYLDMQRRTGYYITQVYIPILMFTLLSFISFWLGPNPNTRLSLTLTVLLTMATSINGFNQNTPKVTYMRALDVWTAFSLTLVCACTLESAVIAFWIQKDGQVSDFESESNRVSPLGNTNNKEGALFDVEKSHKIPSLYMSRIVKLDRISRIMFPLCHVLFAIVYSLAYVLIEKPLY